MSPAQTIRMISREFRGVGPRLVYFTGCLGIGVAAVIAVATLAASFRDGFQSGAKELLGADIAIESSRPFPEDIRETIAAALGEQFGTASITYSREQPSLISAVASETSMLAELKILDGNYPHYGSFDLEPGGDLNTLLGPTAVVVEPDILTQLNAKVGDVIGIGGTEFTIAAAAGSRPDRITGFMYIGPRVFMDFDAFSATQNAGFDARVRNEMLIALPGADIATIEQATTRLQEAFEGERAIDVDNFLQGQASLQRGLDRLEVFLGLIALLSLLLGGVGVSQAVRTWIDSRMDAIAILKCLGIRPREVLALYFSQALLLGLIGSGAGALFAVLILAAIPPLLSQYIPAGLVQPVQLAAILRGLALGVAVTCAFSLAPLLSTLRVSPSRVLRRDAEPLPMTRWANWLTTIAVLGAIGVMAMFQAGSAIVGMAFSSSVLGGAAALTIGSYLTIRLVSKSRGAVGSFTIRHGLAALSRPGAPTLSSIVAIGLGVLVLFTTFVMQVHLNRVFDAEIPKRVPSVFMVNVFPPQVAGLTERLEAAGATEVELDPMQSMQVVAFNGKRIGETSVASREGRHRGRGPDRQMVLYRDTLPNGSRIETGTDAESLWTLPDAREVSLDARFARRRELKIGDTITLLLAGQETEFTITSLREDDWRDGIGGGFSIIAEPDEATIAAVSYFGSARMPRDAEMALQNEVAAQYPNVLLVRVSDILERVARQIGRISWGIRFLSLFIIGAGLAVLAGAVSIESLQRGREVALLKTLGMTRAGVGAAFATEYALVGLVASVIGVAAGTVLSFLVITRALEFEFSINPGYLAAAAAITTGLCVVVGILAAIPALRHPPIETLRNE